MTRQIGMPHRTLCRPPGFHPVMTRINWPELVLTNAQDAQTPSVTLCLEPWTGNQSRPKMARPSHGGLSNIPAMQEGAT